MSSNTNMERGDAYIATLLPWYITGKLGRQEREIVEANLLRSSSLRRKLQVCQCIAQHLQIEPENATAERGIWDRLQTSLGADQHCESTIENTRLLGIGGHYWARVLIPLLIAISLTTLLVSFVLGAAAPNP